MMCEWGCCDLVRVKIAPQLSHTGKAYWKWQEIDHCISDLVSALQIAGIDMLGSCCGHGKGLGSIHLADGRVLIVMHPNECHGEQPQSLLDGGRVLWTIGAMGEIE